MPYNGSGVFTLSQAAFVPNTPISSSAMNSDLSDLATNGLSNAVTKDGQTTITGPIRFASGTVGLPAMTFAADPDTGFYRLAANSVGVTAGGSLIVGVTTTGVAINGTLSVSGAFSPAGQFLAADGTVLLPEYSFTSDPDSGIYRIGANNLGVAVNAAKVLDIGVSGLNVVGTISANGAALTPLAQAAGMVNGTVVESHAGNAVTFAIKTLAGTDPSATDIVYFVFRNVTAATGNYVVLQVTAALSLTVSSGSTLGTASSNVPFKLWLVAFNDASTVRLGVINTVLGGATPTGVYPLGQFLIASAVSEGGAGGADSAQVFYANATVTSKAYEILAYAAYETGVTTAGSWAATPTRLQLYGAGVPLPGQAIQTAMNFTGASTTGTTTIPYDNTIPQNTEGDQYMSQAITPTSTSNNLDIDYQWNGAIGSGSSPIGALFQDATVNAIAVSGGGFSSNAASVSLVGRWIMKAGTTSSTTFKLRVGSNSASTNTFNGSAGAGLFNGTYASFMRVVETMT